LGYLEERGYTLVKRYHRTRYGEIDLVLRDEETLVLIPSTKRQTPHYDSMLPTVKGYLQRLAMTLNHKVLCTTT